MVDRTGSQNKEQIRPLFLIVHMKKALREFAHIQAGYSFREGISPIDHGSVRVIQIKDIGAFGNLLKEGLAAVDADNLKPDFYVRPGDVLFTTRGASRRAAAIDEELANTIFVAQIFAVRNLDDGILPEYLAWYLNQAPAQEHFDTFTSGATIQNVRKEVLAALPVDVPSIETQRLVLKIVELRRREISLTREIENKRAALIHESLLRAISS